MAVLAVLFYHAELGAPGGYVGVDVFFVISGFLITRWLVGSLAEGRFHYLDFCERRVRRLLPCLALVSSVASLLGYFLLLPGDLRKLGGALISQLVLSANVYFDAVIDGSYFGDSPEQYPLLHTWSLGVEEQFYLLYPMLLTVLFRTLPSPKARLGALLLLAVGSFELSLHLSISHPTKAFFLFPTRAWELLMGALLVMLPSRRSSLPVRELAGWAGLAMILWSVWQARGQEFLATSTVVPCCGAALVIWANGEGLRTSGRLLAAKPLVAVGLASYSLYLWHWPLLAYGHYFGLTREPVVKWALVLFSVVLSGISYRYVESPVRAGRVLRRRSSLAYFAVSYAVFALVTGGYFLFTMGLPGNWTVMALSLEGRGRVVEQEPAQINLAADRPVAVALGDRASPKLTFLVWGDSHAGALSPLLDQLGREFHLRGALWVRSGTAGLVETANSESAELQRWGRWVVEEVAKEKVDVVFLISRWSIYDRRDLTADLDRTVRKLRSVGAEVIFVSDVPEQPGVTNRLLALSTRFPALPVPFASLEQHRETNARVSEALEALPQETRRNLIISDPAPVVLGWKALVIRGEPVYSDTDHLTRFGAMQLRSIFEPHFREHSAAFSSRILDAP